MKQKFLYLLLVLALCSSIIITQGDEEWPRPTTSIKGVEILK